MKVGSKEKKIWTCVGNTGKSTAVTGYFLSMDQEVRDHVPKIMNSIAAQIYYCLLKRGCTKDRIQNNVQVLFHQRAKSNYHQIKVLKLARSSKNNGQGGMWRYHYSGKDQRIDVDLALFLSQLKEKQHEREFKASAILYGQTKPGDLEGYNFAEEQSLTTLNTNRDKLARLLVLNTLAKSLYIIRSTKGGSIDGSEMRKRRNK